ncbi:Chitin synthase, class 7 [Cladochytrium tenue]|nr:Chitin synthase, class 7 [Cladochytrium tenue]
MSTTSTAFAFGSFDYLCSQVALPACPLLGSSRISAGGPGSEPLCYSRNINVVGGLLVFEPGALAVHLAAIVVAAIIIFNIKSKYTAVGRKEIVFFFYMYGLTVIFEFLLVSNFVPTASVVYPQALITSPFSADSPIGLYIVYLVFPALMIIVYVVMQVIMVVYTLDSRWSLGDLFAGAIFFIIGIVFQFAVSVDICQLTTHYADGLFFCTFCTLLAVMMVYKFWDSITKEDLEFAVGGGANVWEIKDPLLNDVDDTEFDVPSARSQPRY